MKYNFTKVTYISQKQMWRNQDFIYLFIYILISLYLSFSELFFLFKFFVKLKIHKAA